MCLGGDIQYDENQELQRGAELDVESLIVSRMTLSTKLHRNAGADAWIDFFERMSSNDTGTDLGLGH